MFNNFISYTIAINGWEFGWDVWGEKAFAKLILKLFVFL
jgi:hypothetical protein